MINEKELVHLEKIRQGLKEKEGDNLHFELARSKSSGEIFTKFYD